MTVLTLSQAAADTTGKCVISQKTYEFEDTSDSTGAADTSGNIKMSLLRADTLIKHTENFAPTSAAAVARRKVSLLMAPYLDAGSSGLYARITRG